MGSSLDIITTYHYDRNDRIVWEKRDVTFDGNGDRYIEYFYGDNGQSTRLVQRDEFKGLVADRTEQSNENYIELLSIVVF